MTDITVTDQTRLASRRDLAPVYALEEQLRGMPQVEMPLVHDFCEGVYARTLHIPAGTVLVSAVHRGECFFVIRQGEIMVTTDDGPKQIGAGFMAVTPAGTKRAGYALTDTIVTTFHHNPTNETAPQALWDLYTIPPSDDMLTDKTQETEMLHA